MKPVKYLVCGDVKKPHRSFGDAGVDLYVPKNTERFVSDLMQANPDIAMANHVSNIEGVVVYDDCFEVKPQHDVRFPLYVKSRISPDTVLLVTNKSGVCFKQKLAAGAGTIDASYQGVHHAHLYNFGDRPQKIYFGQKIIQEIPIMINPDDIDVVEGQSEEDFYKGFESHRGDGCFGSSGLD